MEVRREQPGAFFPGIQQLWMGSWVNFPHFPVVPGQPLGEMHQSGGTSLQRETLLRLISA